MTDLHTLRRGGVEDTKDEMARRAVKNFRAFQPTLSAYARALTGRKDVRVEMHASSNGKTDGKVIYYRPPIEMGDNTPHVRRLCNKRDEQLQLLCKACALREHVLVVIYHEINHIAEGTFELTTEADKSQAIKRAVAEVGTKYAKQIEAAVKNAPSYVTGSYLGLAGIISPFLPVIVNALEDARVNSRCFEKRKGTRVMFNADTQSIFMDGVEQKDPATGEIVKIMWKDYPLNSQVSVGVFCKASGYNYDDWFAPVVKQALDDPALTELISRLKDAKSASDSYELAFPILARLRELGFCKSDKDPEDEEEQEEHGNSDSSDQGLQNPGEEQSDDEGGSAGASVPSDEADESGDDEASSGDGSKSDDGDSQSDRQDAGPEDEAEEETGGDGSDDNSAGSSTESGEESGDDSSAGDGQEESEPSDEGGAMGEADSEPTDSQSEHGDSAAGSAEGGSSEEQELDSTSTGKGSETVDADSDAQPDSEGQPSAQQEPPQGGQGSDEDSDSDSEAASDGDTTGDDERLDEDRGDEGSGRAESDDSLEHSEDSGDLDDLGDDSEQDGEADDPLRSSADEESAEDSEPTPIDTGADEGLGGTQLIIPDDANMGDADDAMEGLLKVEQHDEKPETAEMRANDEAMEVAVIQGLYFETPSTAVTGVRENKFGTPSDTSRARRNSWEKAETVVNERQRIILGIDGDFDPQEEILGPALLHMRVVFSDNQRGKNHIHLKSGRVNGKVLGKRAPVHDPRLFKKRTQPGKKDYLVVIGVDISGSTTGENLVLTKKAVMAQATLLSRMGIKFAIYAHSGAYTDRSLGRTMVLDMYEVKNAEEPWTEGTKDRLRKLSAYEVNIDGHALEYLRKVADRSQATDKVILYYSDGKMPAENYDEELEILQREIKICHQKGYALLGVGIRTDSPVRHGLDTVQVDEDSDLVKVVRHIEKRLLAQ
jgi:hypothetical protein